MLIKVRQFNKEDVSALNEIWNDVVFDGLAFPQLDYLDMETGFEFFKEQSFTAVAEINNEIVGLYILHPNNVGRCSHISNASYAVKKEYRGKNVGEKLVCHCLEKARELDFKILQFNAVVANNTPALNLYKKLGFTRLGTIPKGFLLKNGTYEDIVVHYITL